MHIAILLAGHTKQGNAPSAFVIIMICSAIFLPAFQLAKNFRFTTFPVVDDVFSGAN